MSRLMQYQRRALEALKPKRAVPFNILKDDEAHYYITDENFCFNGARIYLLGISTGVGTCADLHNVNIAIFSRKKSSSPPRFPTGQDRVSVQWSALLRKPNESELKEWLKNQAGPCLVVEELEFRRSFQKNFLLVLTEKKELYSNII